MWGGTNFNIHAFIPYSVLIIFFLIVALYIFVCFIFLFLQLPNQVILDSDNPSKIFNNYIKKRLKAIFPPNFTFVQSHDKDFNLVVSHRSGSHIVCIGFIVGKYCVDLLLSCPWLNWLSLETYILGAIWLAI